jgi:hypothetical protein
MAANRQQGAYLTEFLAAFTAFPAGLVLLSLSSYGIGIVLTIVGLGMFVHSSVGFYRIKKLEFPGES